MVGIDSNENMWKVQYIILLIEIDWFEQIIIIIIIIIRIENDQNESI